MLLIVNCKFNRSEMKEAYLMVADYLGLSLIRFEMFNVPVLTL